MREGEALSKAVQRSLFYDSCTVGSTNLISGWVKSDFDSGVCLSTMSLISSGSLSSGTGSANPILRWVN